MIVARVLPMLVPLIVLFKRNKKVVNVMWSKRVHLSCVWKNWLNTLIPSLQRKDCFSSGCFFGKCLCTFTDWYKNYGTNLFLKTSKPICLYVLHCLIFKWSCRAIANLGPKYLQFSVLQFLICWAPSRLTENNNNVAFDGIGANPWKELRIISPLWF